MRLLVGMAAIVAGLAVCILPWKLDGDQLLGVTVLMLFSIFQWADYGVFIVLGLASLGSMFLFFYFYITERAPAVSLFASFTSAAIYFSASTFGSESRGTPGTWGWSLLLYALFSVAYWLLPLAIWKGLEWKAERDAEKEAAAEGGDAGQNGPS